MFDDKVILVTGGTGSFGNKFIDVVLRNFKPKKVIVKPIAADYIDNSNKIPSKVLDNIILGDSRDLGIIGITPPAPTVTSTAMNPPSSLADAAYVLRVKFPSVSGLDILKSTEMQVYSLMSR